MLSRRAVAVVLAATAMITLSACTGPSEDAKPAVTTPQAELTGEWVVTRTVVTSNDTANPARVVGAASVRYVLIDRDPCDEALCAGTVSSGSALEGRVETELTQTDGGLDYEFSGALDCINAATGGVLAVDGFEFTQKATLAVGESADVDGAPTASTLVGTISYTDTVTAAARDLGCARDPATVTVEYAVAATRAP